MSATESGGTCSNCGAALAPADAACATCGKLAPAAVPHSAGTLAPTKMTRSAEVTFGILAGFAGGIALTIAFIFVTVLFALSAAKVNVPGLFYVGIGVELVVLVALLPVGIRFIARGRVLLGTGLIVAGIVAALPTAACDLALQGMGIK